MFHQIATQADKQSVFIMWSDGETNVIAGSHPQFRQIVAALQSGGDEDAVRTLTDGAAAAKRYIAVSERLTLRGSKLYFDGDRLRSVLAKHIVRMMNAGDDAGALKLVAFLEKLATNPSVDSQESLYRWLRERDFTITADGSFIAYKGLLANGTSVRRGTATVDGVRVTGHIPNEPGTVVEMPRSSVDARRFHECSHGLHAGTHAVARGFSGIRVVTVVINPRDVVSVPDDAASQKLRVCRYRVLDVVTGELAEPTIDTGSPAETAA